MGTGITIAIDGYSSCGKSTLAQDLAQRLGYVHVDSGAMYRAVTLYFLRNRVKINSPEQIRLALDKINIGFVADSGRQLLFLNGENVDDAIRSFEVNKLVSPVAAISEVRKFLVAQQRSLGNNGSIVMDGRDIGTVVFPQAQLKIFLTASVDVRIERRYMELTSKGKQTTREEVAESLAYRDHIDTTRDDSPLRQAEDAVLIDNTLLSRKEQLSVALRYAEERIGSTSTTSQQS